MPDTPRPQLIHLDVDRRLGHEWDEWDGRPLPNQGNYDSPPALFFAWSAITLAIGLGVRQSFGIFLKPVSAELDVGRELFSFGTALSMLLMGVFAPFSGRLAEIGRAHV